MSETTLLSAAYVVPVRPRGRVFHQHTVVVRDDRVTEILPTEEARKKFSGVKEVLLPDHVLIPGLINMHTHSAMSLLRGIADDLDMQDWLQHHIWPIENNVMSAEFVAAGTRLAIAEMLRAGTTCFNELYFYPEAILDVVSETGIRVNMGLAVLDVPNAWTSSATECLQIAEQLLQSHPERVSFALAPHAPYSVGDQSFRAIVELSTRHGLPVHLHLLETTYDVEHSLKEYGERPLQRLQRLGLLDERLMAVHMTQLQPADFELLQQTGVHVIHCPRSNLKLASGFCPVAELMKAGINLSVGTDGAASNNSLDVLAEAQFAGLLAKGVAGDATLVDSLDILDMVTINAAQALGQAANIGSIEPGKKADLAALELSQPETQPLHNVFSQLAYSASSSQFSHVWVDGKLLLNDRELVSIDVNALLDDTECWRDRINPRAGTAYG